MEQISFHLSGSTIKEVEMTENVEVLDGEKYYSALSRSLKKGQADFNSLLTKLVDENKKRSKESEQVTLHLSGSKIEDVQINENIEIIEGENYYSALKRSLKTAQGDFNSLLTKVVDADRKSSKGTPDGQRAKKLKK